VQQPVKQQIINLSADIFFTCLLKLIKDSFKTLSQMFIKDKRNPRVNKHYHITRNCLEKCLEDPLYNVLLMLVLIYRLSLVILFVAISKKGFEVNNRKDPAQFAANLATRML
jgi:hypothetical protein